MRATQTTLSTEPDAAADGSWPESVFSPVPVRNAFEMTVERLASAIRLGILAAGDRLPSERDLSEQLGVSRMTLREAIKALREVGLVDSRRGRSGGTFIRAPLTSHPRGPRSIGRSMGAELQDALDMRRIVEPGAAELAALRCAAAARADPDGAGPNGAGPNGADPNGADPNGAGPNGADPDGLDAGAATSPAVAALRTCLANSRSAAPHERRIADSRLHLAVAAAAGSPSLTSAVAQVQLTLDELLRAIPVLAANIAHSDAQHERIVEAIAAGDADVARTTMCEHVDATAALLIGLIG